jgi:hypothetical protein
MKTKNILVLGLMAMATVALTGCSDSFLEEENPSAAPVDEYYLTDAHLQEAVVAAYDPLHWPDWGNGGYNPINISSDIMAADINVGGVRHRQLFWLLMANYSANSNNTLAALWVDEYSGVKRCNDVIAYVANAQASGKSDLTEANALDYTTQARVLRAYYYMNLWKFWGNIPFFTTNLSGNTWHRSCRRRGVSQRHRRPGGCLGQQITADEGADATEGRVTSFRLHVYARW